MKKIYLAGAIMNKTAAESVEWRKQAGYKLSNLGFKCLDPMRRNFRDTEFQSQNEIVMLDKNDIIDCDVLLVNATKDSWGTAMEVIFAFEHHKIVVAFTGTDFKRSNPWLAFHSTRVTKTMDDAIEYIVQHLR